MKVRMPGGSGITSCREPGRDSIPHLGTEPMKDPAPEMKSRDETRNEKCEKMWSVVNGNRNQGIATGSGKSIRREEKNEET